MGGEVVLLVAWVAWVGEFVGWLGGWFFVFVCFCLSLVWLRLLFG